MKTNKEKIKQLLLADQQNLVARRCLDVIDVDTTQAWRTNYPPFVTEKVRRDYKIRAEINNELCDASQFTEGYSELIAGLEQLTEDTLIICSFAASKNEYRIFATLDLDRLVGILEIPHLLKTST